MDIAIVGTGCRLPGGADTLDAFSELLCGGIDAIGEIPPERLDVGAFFDPDPGAPGKTDSRWRRSVDDVDRFRADSLRISPRGVMRLDPQHRLLLEVDREPLEHGGHVPEHLAGTTTGVTAGGTGRDGIRPELAGASVSRRAPASRRRRGGHSWTGSSSGIR